MMHGPRRLSADGSRVTLPRGLAAGLRLAPGRYVLITQSARHRGELTVRRANKPRATLSERDVKRPRQISPHGQFTLPAALLEAVELGPSQPWLYFAHDDRELAIRLIPAPLVSYHVGGGDR